MLVLMGHYPEPWKMNRTTLIPKAGKDAKDIKNWKPITIASMLSRIFSAIIDRRLSASITQNVRQKGFTSDDGCKQNTMIFKEAIEMMKTSKGGISTVVDISKAFDTVPHVMIGAGLRRKGVPEHLTKLVENMYVGCTTDVRARDEIVRIELKRGVKQGDLLSPLLFNLAIEPIIEKLSNETQRISVDNVHRLAALAFADNLIMIGRDGTDAQEQLTLLDEFLTSLGMSLVHEKCAAFEIRARQKTWFIQDRKLTMRGVSIRHILPDETFPYLRAKYSPWAGLTRGTEIPSVIKAI